MHQIRNGTEPQHTLQTHAVLQDSYSRAAIIQAPNPAMITVEAKLAAAGAAAAPLCAGALTVVLDVEGADTGTSGL